MVQLVSVAITSILTQQSKVKLIKKWVALVAQTTKHMTVLMSHDYCNYM